jgi:hypothetical protein
MYKNQQLLMSATKRNSLYYVNIVENKLPSEKTNKVEQINKQINKIEPTNENNLLVGT